MKRQFCALFSALMISLLPMVGCGGGNIAPQQEDVEEAASTETAPEEKAYLADYDAVVYTAEGDKTSLVELADGKPLVVNYWATWCPYCVDEMPDFQEIYHDYQDRVSFAFVDVTDGEDETTEVASAWLAKNGLEELPDYYDVDGEAVRAFNVWSYPTTVLVAADGQILAVSPGRIDPMLLRGALDTVV